MTGKLKAFTLLELLIGMIISSLVIAFGYGSYELIYKQFLNYKNVKVQLIQAEQLRSTWTTDMQKAKMVSFNENKLNLSQEDDILEYTFLDSMIIRKDKEVSDTFFVAVQNIKCDFLFPEERMFVSKFAFTTTILQSNEPFCMEKNYSAEALMKYAPVLKSKIGDDAFN